MDGWLTELADIRAQAKQDFQLVMGWAPWQHRGTRWRNTRGGPMSVTQAVQKALQEQQALWEDHKIRLRAVEEHLDFRDEVFTIPRFQNGDARHIPLSDGALEILRGLPSRLVMAGVGFFLRSRRPGDERRWRGCSGPPALPPTTSRRR